MIIIEAQDPESEKILSKFSEFRFSFPDYDHHSGSRFIGNGVCSCNISLKKDQNHFRVHHPDDFHSRNNDDRAAV